MFIISRLFLYTPHTVFCHASMVCLGANSSSYIVLAARHPIDAPQNTLCCMDRNSLLMMKIGLFETYRG